MSERYSGQLYLLEAQSTDKSFQSCEACKTVSYDCTIINNIAKLSLQQAYNTSSFTVEAIYKLRLESNSCLDSFAAVYNGNVIRGIIKEKKQAQEEYQKAKSEGDTVTLAELKKINADKWEGEEITFHLGNIPPQCQIIITVEIIFMAKSFLNRFYMVSIPLPKSIYQSVNKIKDHERRKQWQEKVNLINEITNSQKSCDFKLDLYTTGVIKQSLTNIEGIQEQIIDSFHRFYTKPLKSISLLDSFKLIYRYANIHVPQVIFGTTQIFNEDIVKQSIMPQRDSAMISFLPNFFSNKAARIDIEVEQLGQKVFDEDFSSDLIQSYNNQLAQSKTEFIFLLDRSGSMDGQQINEAKQALEIFLKSLPVDSYFNVISFGSRFELMFNKSSQYDGQSLKYALEKIKLFTADMGGTNIKDPLLNVFTMCPNIPFYQRQIYLLTDGEVEEFQNVIDLIKKFNNYNRVHAIQLGSSAQDSQIRALSRAGRGAYKKIKDVNRISDDLISLLQVSLSPMLHDFQIQYDKTLFEELSYPSTVEQLPLVFQDEIFCLHLFFKQGIDVSMLNENQKKLEISYFNSLSQAQTRQVIKLDPMDVFGANLKLRNSIFKQGKQLLLNEAIEKMIKSPNEIISQCQDYQVLTELTAVICVIEKTNDEKKQYYQTVNSSTTTSSTSQYNKRTKAEMRLINSIRDPMCVPSDSDDDDTLYQSQTNGSNSKSSRPMTSSSAVVSIKPQMNLAKSVSITQNPTLTHQNQGSKDDYLNNIHLQKQGPFSFQSQNNLSSQQHVINNQKFSNLNNSAYNSFQNQRMESQIVFNSKQHYNQNQYSYSNIS